MAVCTVAVGRICWFSVFDSVCIVSALCGLLYQNPDYLDPLEI